MKIATPLLIATALSLGACDQQEPPPEPEPEPTVSVEAKTDDDTDTTDDEDPHVKVEVGEDGAMLDVETKDGDEVEVKAE